MSRDIKVYCDDRTHDPQRVATVGYLVEWGDGAIVMDSKPRKRNGVPDRYLRQENPAPMPRERAESLREMSGRRDGEHYTFRCPVCGINVTMRAETVNTVYRGLVEAGVPDVSLGALARILSSRER